MFVLLVFCLFVCFESAKQKTFCGESVDSLKTTCFWDYFRVLNCYSCCLQSSHNVLEQQIDVKFKKKKEKKVVFLFVLFFTAMLYCFGAKKFWKQKKKKKESQVRNIETKMKLNMRLTFWMHLSLSLSACPLVTEPHILMSAVSCPYMAFLIPRLVLVGVVLTPAPSMTQKSLCSARSAQMTHLHFVTDSADSSMFGVPLAQTFCLQFSAAYTLLFERMSFLRWFQTRTEHFVSPIRSPLSLGTCRVKSSCNGLSLVALAGLWADLHLIWGLLFEQRATTRGSGVGQFRPQGWTFPSDIWIFQMLFIFGCKTLTFMFPSLFSPLINQWL